MGLIRDDEVRKTIAKTLRTEGKGFPDDSESKLLLKQVDALSAIFQDRRREANSEATKFLKRELSISYVSILALTITCLALNQKNKKRLIPKRIKKGKGGVNADWFLQSLVLQVTNYSLAVVRLVEDGLDNAARCILRALNELSCQLLVLMSDHDQMAAYVKSINPQESKQIWYELFAKKGRLRKNLEKLEQTLGMPSDLTNELRLMREDFNSTHSQAVHHSFASTVILAYSGDFENTESLHFSLLGKSTTASKHTLETLNTILFYTLLMFFAILVTVHGVKLPIDDKWWKGAYLLTKCVENLGKDTIEEGQT